MKKLTSLALAIGLLAFSLGGAAHAQQREEPSVYYFDVDENGDGTIDTCVWLIWLPDQGISRVVEVRRDSNSRSFQTRGFEPTITEECNIEGKHWHCFDNGHIIYCSRHDGPHLLTYPERARRIRLPNLPQYTETEPSEGTKRTEADSESHSLNSLVSPVPSLPQEMLRELTTQLQTVAVNFDEWEVQKVELLNNGNTIRKIEKNKSTGATRTTTRVNGVSTTVEIDNGDGTGSTTSVEVAAGGVLRGTVQTRGKGIIETRTTEMTAGQITKTTYTRQVENANGEWSSVTDEFEWQPLTLPNGVQIWRPARKRTYGTFGDSGWVELRYVAPAQKGADEQSYNVVRGIDTRVSIPQPDPLTSAILAQDAENFDPAKFLDGLPEAALRSLGSALKAAVRPGGAADAALDGALAGKQVNKALLYEAIRRHRLARTLPQLGWMVLTAIATSPIPVVHEAASLLHVVEAGGIFDEALSKEAKLAAEKVKQAAEQVKKAKEAAEKASDAQEKNKTEEELKKKNEELKKAIEELKKAIGAKTEPNKQSSPNSSVIDQETALQDQLLDEGTVFATAVVEPGTTIEILEPAVALVATADVVERRPVKPGDTLPAESTLSVRFQDGTGFVTQLVPSMPSLEVTVGNSHVLDDKYQGLPIHQGSVTMFVGSNRPFASVAIGTEKTSVPPAKTHAVLTRAGAKAGEFVTFKKLDSKLLSANVRVWTLDESGRWIRTGEVRGTTKDGTLHVSFDRGRYETGQSGVLRIANQENYTSVLGQTRFSGTGKALQHPIQIDWSSNLVGPSKVQPGTREVNFQAVSPGKANAAVTVTRPDVRKPSSGLRNRKK